MRTFLVSSNMFGHKTCEHEAEYTPVMNNGVLVDVLLGCDGEFLLSLKDEFIAILGRLDLGDGEY